MHRYLAVPALLLALAACEQIKQRTSGGGGPATTATTAQAAPAPASEGQARQVKSVDGSFDGELVGGDPAPGSKFSKVKIGMRMKEIEKLIGEPDDTDSHITGKMFIPFFFGGDTHRLEHFYTGEGILTYSPAHFAGEPNVLIRMIVDKSERGVAH